MSQKDVSPRVILACLQAQEQLLWWGRPKIKYIRQPVRPISFFKSGFFFFSCMLPIISFMDDIMNYGVAQIDIVIERFLHTLWFIGIIYLVAFLLFCMKDYYAKYFSATQKVRYHKYIYYAITDRRALIIIYMPGQEPAVVEVLPEILPQPQSSDVHRSGAGTVTFGAPREIKFGRYGPTITLSGTFWGVSDVQKIVGLLTFLQLNGKIVPEDVPG